MWIKIWKRFLEPIKQKYSISYFDLWTLFGVTTIKEMNEPEIPWYSDSTRNNSTTIITITIISDECLPSVDSDVSYLRSIFGRINFTDKEIVVLVDIYVIGRCRAEVSCYCDYGRMLKQVFQMIIFVYY